MDRFPGGKFFTVRPCSQNNCLITVIVQAKITCVIFLGAIDEYDTKFIADDGEVCWI